MSHAQRQHEDISRDCLFWADEEDDDAPFPESLAFSPHQDFSTGNPIMDYNISNPIVSDGAGNVEAWPSQTSQSHLIGKSHTTSTTGDGVGTITDCSQNLGDRQFSSIRQQHHNQESMEMFISNNPKQLRLDYSGRQNVQGTPPVRYDNPSYSSMQYGMPTSCPNNLPAPETTISKATSFGLDAVNQSGDGAAESRSWQKQSESKRRRIYPSQQGSVIASSSTLGASQPCDGPQIVIFPQPLNNITLFACRLWLSQYPQNPQAQPDEHAICALSTAFNTSTKILRSWFANRQQFYPDPHDASTIADTGCRLWISLHPRITPDVHEYCALSVAFNKPAEYIQQWFARTLQANTEGYQGTNVLTAPLLIDRDAAVRYQHNQKSCRNGQNSSLCEGWTAERRYSCTFRCGIRFKKKSDWQRHEETNYPQSIWSCRMVQCQTKPFVTIRKDKAKKHLEEQHPSVEAQNLDSCRIAVDSKFSTTCVFKGCEETFLGDQSWKRRLEHIATQHMEKGSWDASDLKELEPET